MTTDDLKPCPFCGAPALGLQAMHAVRCSDDSGETCGSTYFDPVEWNRRPVEDALQARAEAAEAEVARLRAALEQAQDDAELERGRVAALEACVATRDDAITEAHAEVARLRAELAQTTDDPTTTRNPSAPRLTPDALAEVYAIGGYRAIIDAADGHIAAPMLRALAHIGGLAHAAAGYPRHLLSPLRDVLAAVDRLPDAGALAAWALGELPAGDVEPRPDGEVERLRAERDEARAAAGAAAAVAQAAQAGAARMRAEAVEARDDAELERGRVAALEMCVATRDEAIAEAHAEVARLRAALEQAWAEGEAAGAARERAATAAYLRRHDVVIEDRRATQSADMGSRLVVVHVVPRDAAADIEAGAHVGAAGGGAR